MRSLNRIRRKPAVASACAARRTPGNGTPRRAAPRPSATALSDYRRLRREIGLACYGEAELKRLLAAHGFVAERLPWNVGFTRRRLTLRARGV